MINFSKYFEGVIIFPLLIIFFLYLFFITKNPESFCQDTSFLGSIKRDLIHSSPMQLAWTALAIYDLFVLERKIGTFWTVIAIIWAILLSNFIQFHSKEIIQPALDYSERYQILNTVSDLNFLNTKIPCDLGFIGVTIALDIMAIYLTSRGRLTSSWENIQWAALNVIPALLFTNTTVHGQVSGLAAGVLTVVLLDMLGIGYR